MGVWIETALADSKRSDKESHPVWVCGLKLNQHTKNQDGDYVTPCMGVWIETIVML